MEKICILTKKDHHKFVSPVKKECECYRDQKPRAEEIDHLFELVVRTVILDQTQLFKHRNEVAVKDIVDLPYLPYHRDTRFPCTVMDIGV
ncbi:MAG: hypothetical protein IE918_07840 [Campylobacterales bacterium]|nr:hypothetical protein [Campylobacterales bacterium]